MTVQAGEGEAAFWRAVALLRFDRAGALADLARVFAAGDAPAALDGPYTGRLLATTVQPGLDRFADAVAAAWMPWRGKVFDAGAREGRNRFTTAGGWAIARRFPSYAGVGAGAPGEVTAFRFVTSRGPSALTPERPVLRIDYDLPDNPPGLIRRVLDEVVAVSPGVYLGQALLRRPTGYRRLAWFALEA